MSFPREQWLSVTQHFSYVAPFVLVSCSECFTNKPHLSPEEPHAHSSPLKLPQQLCVSVCVRFCTWMCMHMRMHAHPSDVWNWTPPQRAGQVTPLPGCNRRLLWPLPPPLLFNPPFVVSKSCCTHRPVCWQSDRFNAGSAFPGEGADRVSKKGVWFGNWSRCHFHPPPPILAFHVNQTSEVFGCGYGACVDAVWRYTGLIVSLTNSCFSIHL